MKNTSFKRFLFAMTLILIAIISIAGYLYFAKQKSALAAGNIYYIDYINGSDANSGLSKDVPWKRAPGMVGCSDNCLAKKNAGINPGDQIILKGGVIWPNNVLGWLINFNGNATDASPGCSGNGCIYIGVDKLWYAGELWTRPILDAGGIKTATDAGGVSNYLMRLYANYIIVDNIEFKGLYWDANDINYGESVNIHIAAGTVNKGTNILLKNLYIHGWTHDSYANGARQRSCAIMGDTAVPNNNVNTILQDSVIDGSDTARDSCSGVFGSPPYIERNYFRYMANGMIVNGSVKIRGNTILDIGSCFDPNAHTNGIEINLSNDIEVSNNIVGRLFPGTVGIWTAPNQGHTATIFNNILFDTDPTQILLLSRPLINNGCEPYGTTYCKYAGTNKVYNNTIEAGPDSNPKSAGISINQSVASVDIYNNHIITNAITPNGGIWQISATGIGTPAVVASNNIVQAKSIANEQGYTSTQIHPFSPISLISNTVDIGISLTSTACQFFPDLCNSATVGVTYDESSHTVSYPYRASIPRGSAWDIGAYEYIQASPPLKGDFNSDKKVNDLDFTSFKNAFKSIFNSIFDLNSDNAIDVRDLGVLMNGWLP